MLIRTVGGGTAKVNPNHAKKSSGIKIKDLGTEPSDPTAGIYIYIYTHIYIYIYIYMYQFYSSIYTRNIRSYKYKYMHIQA